MNQSYNSEEILPNFIPDFHLTNVEALALSDYFSIATLIFLQVSILATNMSYGLRRNKIESGSGGKRGHSNMVHWEYTEEIKQRSRKARRRAAKSFERDARQTRE